MTKLTPNFAEQRSDGIAPQVVAMPNPVVPPMPPKMGKKPKITEAHEPLKEDVVPLNDPIPQVTIPPGAFQHFAPFPMPPVAPAPEPQALKIALVGTAPSSRMMAPFNDPSWTIWACSPGNMNALPKVDVWFELHANLHWPECQSYGLPYIDWLRRLNIPVMMQPNDYKVPNCQIFPMEQMVNEFGPDFFTSSFAWMMAYAIHMGAKEIALFGIDMASRDEYILQRPGFYYFKNIAQMRGIKVWAPNESDIMQHAPLYGYSDVTPLGRKLNARMQELKARLEQMKQERAKLEHNITYLEGAVEDLDYVSSIWMGVATLPANLPPKGG